MLDRVGKVPQVQNQQGCILVQAEAPLLHPGLVGVAPSPVLHPPQLRAAHALPFFWELQILHMGLGGRGGEGAHFCFAQADANFWEWCFFPLASDHRHCFTAAMVLLKGLLQLNSLSLPFIINKLYTSFMFSLLPLKLQNKFLAKV